MATATKSKPAKTKSSSCSRSATAWSSAAKRAKRKTAGGIVLPDSAKEKPQRGVIVSVGNGKLLDDGSRGKLQVKPGDRVLFTTWAGETFKIGDDELLLMREEDILAILED